MILIATSIGSIHWKTDIFLEILSLKNNSSFDSNSAKDSMQRRCSLDKFRSLMG